MLIRGHRQFLGDDEELLSERFMGADIWSSGQREQVELIAVNFGRELPNFAAVHEAAMPLRERQGLTPAQFPCLARQLDNHNLGWPADNMLQWWLKGNCPPFWKIVSRRFRPPRPEIPWLALADPASLWRDNDGEWAVPYICVERTGLVLNARSVNARWFAFVWFLFCRT
ncbi:MAG: hypothetical protein Q7S80_02940 [bacterium]|nr:hypothetical protein [bacterium]